MINKKGQQTFNLMSMVGVSLAFVVFGIVVSLCATLLTNVSDSAPNLQAAHVNETLTWAGNNTAINFAEKKVIPGTVVLWNNNTLINQGSTVAGTGNYTANEGSITITNISGIGSQLAMYRTDAFNVSYSYNYGSAARNQSALSLDAVDVVGSYQLLIAVAIIAALLVGIILLYFRIRE